MHIRSMTKQEKMYCYTQSQEIRNKTGNIGYLRADFGFGGEGFYSTWNDFREDLKTDAFIKDLKKVIDSLRNSNKPECFLSNRKMLTKYCLSHPDAEISDNGSFGYRVDTEKYAYMMRLNPARGEYNLYCYCYRKDWLDHHLKEAEQGIRFIDSSYNELFRVPDGGTIRIVYPDGEKKKETCRFVDASHVEVGFGNMNLFHIAEFAERMEKCGAKVEPVDRINTKTKEIAR